MARYKVILAYDGTHFQGFQRQGTNRTVQAELETALRKLGWEGRSILSAGRTDTGVHAGGQVVAFDLDWAHGSEDLANALNNWLADDVAVKAEMVVDAISIRVSMRLNEVIATVFTRPCTATRCASDLHGEYPLAQP